MPRPRRFVSLILASLVAISSQLAHAEEPLGIRLDALLASAKEHNPSLAKKPLLEQSLELEQSRATSMYLPRLSFNGKATWQSEVTEVDVPVPGVSISPPPQDQYQATLDLEQTIWDGGITSDQKRLIRSKSKVEQERVELTFYQVKERILDLYFGAIVQQRLAEQATDLEEYVETLIEKTEVLVEQGLAIERDVLLLRARHLQAKQAHVEAEKSLERIRGSLAELAKMPLSPRSHFDVPREDCRQPRSGDFESSRIKRPELALLDAQAELLEVQKEASHAGDRPRLGAFATGGYGRPGLNFLSDEFDFFFIGGVQLSVPLSYLYTGTHRNDTRQVAVQRSLLERERDAVMMQVNVERAAQSTEIARLDEVIALDEGVVHLRESARKQTEAQIALGTAATADLVSDLTEEDRAKSQLAVHQAQRSLACHELALIDGRL